MTEIEKMYENAGVKYLDSVCSIKELFNTKFVNDCNFGISCYSCPLNKPPFTTEKQLELIKLISLQGQVVIENWKERGFNVEFRANSNMRYITMDCITRKTVEEALAQIINDIWQDLTEEEHKQIKEILECS